MAGFGDFDENKDGFGFIAGGDDFDLSPPVLASAFTAPAGMDSYRDGDAGLGAPVMRGVALGMPMGDNHFGGGNDFGGGGFGMMEFGAPSPQFGLDPKTAHDNGFHPAKLQPTRSEQFSGKHLAMPNLVAEVRPSPADLPPSAPGNYLEPNYHFLSTTSPGPLFQALQQCLDDAQIDYAVKPAKYKYKCVTYRNGARLPFFVRIFSTATPGTFAVEFQRRSGCIIFFSQVYRTAKTKMAEFGHVVSKAGAAAPVKPFDPPALDIEVTREQLAGTVQCLLNMAKSNYTDIQTQAVQALSQMTVAEESRAVVLEHAVEFLVTALAIGSEDVHRCALTSLANLASGNESVCNDLLGSNVVTSASGHTASDCLEVSREATRLLANIGAFAKKRVLDEDPQLTEKLQSLAACGDRKTQTYATRLQACLA